MAVLEPDEQQVLAVLLRRYVGADASPTRRRTNGASRG
jgi:hypothetical protein